MLGVSIPIWRHFDEKVSAAQITKLEDYNLKFDIHNNSDYEELAVINDYYLTKNYSIYLKVNKDIDLEKSMITINNQDYNLESFAKTTSKGYYIYTLVNDYIMAGTKKYNITPHIVGNTVYYTYIFEENSNF